MNTRHNKLLQYLLIILLMITPLRSVMAVQGSHCETDDMSVNGMSISNMSTSGMQDMASSMHQMHMSSNGIDKVAIHQTVNNMVQSDQMQPEHECCCCDDGACVSDCDMGVSVSMLMPNSVYAAVFISTSSSALYSSKLLVRALPPLSRPPVIPS